MAESVDRLITRAELEDGYWTTRCLHLKFKPDAFDAVGDLAEIVESDKIIMDYGRLLAVFIERTWHGGQVFIGRQYLGENQKMLDRFMEQVLPYLEVCYVSAEPNWDDPRLAS